LDEVPDLVDHPAHLGRILVLDGVADPPEPERAQRVELPLVAPVARLPLGDLDGAHASASAASEAGSATASEAASPVDDSSAGRPRTALTERPGSSATSSGVRRDSSPAIVALTRLIGFCEPSDFERMSWIPASSSTARTPPPAMTPVPGAAGFRK